MTPQALVDVPAGAAAGAALTNAAYRLLKRQILECALAPGAEVTERLLTERYDLGKAPLRAALVRLAHEGLVRPMARRGYLVTPITIQDVHDIFALRLLLEPAAARQAAGKVDQPMLKRLDAVCRAGYTPGDRESETRFLDVNRQFHVAIAHAAGNRRLAAVLAQLLEEMERLFHLGLQVRDRSDEMAHEHAALLDALERGDADAAEQATIEQIEAARRMVMDGILDSAWLKDLAIGGVAVSREPGAGSREPGAWSREPGAGSREPGAWTGAWSPAPWGRVVRRPTAESL